MRPSRVVYVENDPALRGIMTDMLAARPEIEVLLSTGSATDALAHPSLAVADVALLDVALGPQEMDGIALGCALRERNANIGLVLHSQHELPHLPARIPASQDWGWSTLHKSAQLDLDHLVRVLVDTAAGRVHRDGEEAVAGTYDPVASLSARQRQIMSLVAAGWDTKAVGDRLDMSVEAVRQDMSRAYRILVPEPAPGRDVKTTAVLVYLRHARGATMDPDG